jgi:hypothetical protein
MANRCSLLNFLGMIPPVIQGKRRENTPYILPPL